MLEKTRLIIVCDEKTKEYANYLRQLISVNDDKDGEVVGTDDGMLEAAVWLDKEYLANSATISSCENVIFIGTNKASKSEISSMKVKFNMFGMKYGWLGKRAMMQVDDAMLNETDYNDFITFCGMYEKEFERIAYKSSKKIETKKTDKDNEDDTMEVEAVERADIKENEDKNKVGLAAGTTTAIAALGILSPLVAIGTVFNFLEISKISEHKKIRDQQYRALTVILYMNGLRSFLEG